MVSTIGSHMTSFAITIWAWELTGQATALALVGFFTQVPRVLISPLAGLIVDRYNRKLLIMVGDTVAALSTLGILLLSLTGHLQIWHLYVAGAIEGTFSQIQELAALSSITMLVPKQQYGRASGMISLLEYGAKIIAPALASVLYYAIGLVGILSIDLFTFVFAISTVLFLHIPQPLAQDRLKQFKIQNSKLKPRLRSALKIVRETFRKKRLLDSIFSGQFIWQEIIFGFHYIFSRPGLLALLITSSLFQFAHDIGAVLYAPMILARSDNDAQVLGSVAVAAGVGGVVGAIIISIKGVPKPRIHGLLLGMLGAGLSKILFGLSRMPLMWIFAQFCSSLNFPLMSSSRDAIWLAQVKPQVQGRVFATRSVIMLITSAIAPLIAGTLADKVFEPAMMPGGSLASTFGSIFGIGRGAGMALLYVIASFCLVVVGVTGCTSKAVREVENM